MSTGTLQQIRREASQRWLQQMQIPVSRLKASVYQIMPSVLKDLDLTGYEKEEAQNELLVIFQNVAKEKDLDLDTIEINDLRQVMQPHLNLFVSMKTVSKELNVWHRCKSFSLEGQCIECCNEILNRKQRDDNPNLHMFYPFYRSTLTPMKHHILVLQTWATEVWKTKQQEDNLDPKMEEFLKTNFFPSNIQIFAKRSVQVCSNKNNIAMALGAGAVFYGLPSITQLLPIGNVISLNTVIKYGLLGGMLAANLYTARIVYRMLSGKESRNKEILKICDCYQAVTNYSQQIQKIANEKGWKIASFTVLGGGMRPLLPYLQVLQPYFQIYSKFQRGALIAAIVQTSVTWGIFIINFAQNYWSPNNDMPNYTNRTLPHDYCRAGDWQLYEASQSCATN